jgi:hypothetical protein
VRFFRSSANDSEIDLLKGSGRLPLGLYAVSIPMLIVILLLIGLGISYLMHRQAGTLPPPNQLALGLGRIDAAWSESFIRQWNDSLNWLSVHGTSLEYSVYNGIASLMANSLLNSNAASIPASELSPLSALFIALHGSALRIVFIGVASARLCLAGSILAFVFGLRSIRAYKGADALGQMGNGRVYYSGAHAQLESVDQHGAPDTLIRGFACPQLASEQMAKSSELWETLTRYDAINQTNLALTRILLRYQDTAAFAASAGDSSEIEDSTWSPGLLNHAEVVLIRALSQQAMFASSEEQEPAESKLAEFNTENSYYSELSDALSSVLTRDLREAIAQIPKDELATLVLALECGKVMAHSFEAGRWVRRSNFPHLCARAILHSIVSFPRDFDTSARSRIRRALVYSVRKSDFAPIRMPIDIDPHTFALRQWSEVLMASPKELPESRHEIALFGLIRDLEALWRSEFFNTSGSMYQNFREAGLAGRDELLFIPISIIVNEWRKFLEPESLAKLRESLRYVADSQARELATNYGDEAENSATSQLSFELVTRPLSDLEISKLAGVHGISEADLKDWVSLRYVLSSFGWLAKRVGDYSVPETYMTFAVFSAKPELPASNQWGFLGLPGMVAIRGTNMREEWGTNWQVRYKNFDRVTIADRREDYDKLSRGIEDLKGSESDPSSENLET